MHRKPEVCILPVAGLSTRNLPATKVLHKGFLTLNNLPIIQYAINACAEIGIKDVVFVYSDQSCKHLFETYFSPNAWLDSSIALTIRTVLQPCSFIFCKLLLIISRISMLSA